MYRLPPLNHMDDAPRDGTRFMCQSETGMLATIKFDTGRGCWVSDCPVQYVTSKPGKWWKLWADLEVERKPVPEEVLLGWWPMPEVASPAASLRS
jgi:hypothetical protein